MNLVWRSPGGMITPGGDPYYECPVCGKGGHLYGVENMENYQQYCRDCGASLRYPWEDELDKIREEYELSHE